VLDRSERNNRSRNIGCATIIILEGQLIEEVEGQE